MQSKRSLMLAALCLSLPLAAALPRQNPFAPRASKEHELLRSLVGTWNAEFQLTIPGAPPTVTHGHEVNELLGELWLVTRYEDREMFGGPFLGAQLLGYDAKKKAYVAAWCDNQSAEMSLQEGAFDPATRTLTLSGPSTDPMTGKPSTSRNVLRWTDDDHRVSELWVPGPGGQEMKVFSIELERMK